MKYILTLSIVFISTLSFSQEIIIDKTPKPLFPKVKIGITGMQNINSRLNAISKNITENTVLIAGFDAMRQGQMMINTLNIGKSFEGLKLEARPSLNVELQNVMYTGTLFNPNRSNFINVKQ